MLGKVCRCQVTSFDSSIRETITTVSNEGEFNGNYSAIELLLIDGVNMKFLPLNIHEHMPNLQGLIIDESNLSSIQRSDLKFLNSLKFLFIGNNNISELDEDLFVDNPRVEWLTFINNFTKKIGKNILKPLSNLTFANFQRNSCISFKAVGSDEIEKLKRFIGRDCA